MPALHPPSATPATSHTNAKLNALRSWFQNLGLIQGYDAPFLHSPSAMRTLRRQGYVDDLIDTPGNRPSTSPPVLASCFASRFLRVRLGTPPREGPLDAWPIATPLPTNVAVARSLSSALQSRALGGQPFLKFLVPHARLTTLRTNTNNILRGSTSTLNNYDITSLCLVNSTDVASRRTFGSVQ